MQKIVFLSNLLKRLISTFVMVSDIYGENQDPDLPAMMEYLYDRIRKEWKKWDRESARLLYEDNPDNPNATEETSEALRDLEEAVDTLEKEYAQAVRFVMFYRRTRKRMERS